MDELPTELILEVAAVLDHRSIRQLSLCSRRIRSALLPLVFETLHISFSSPDELRTAVQQCRAVLGSKLRYVAVLKASAAKLYNPTVYYGMLEKERYTGSLRYAWPDGKESAMVSDEQWQPLVELVRSLPLKRVIWACVEQMPMCIFNLVRETELEMLNFKLESTTKKGRESSISKDDVEIARARITKVVLETWNNRLHYTQEILNEMIGLGYLREIVWSRSQEPMANMAPANPAVKTPWQHGSIALPAAGVLESIATSYPYALKSWSIDFSKLRRLRIQTHIDRGYMEWLATCNLCSLKELALQTYAGTRGVDTLVLSLPPLEVLELMSDCDLAPLVKHCGKALKYLGFDGFINRRLLATLRRCCPNFKGLATGMFRDEANFKAFAALRLDSLSLRLASRCLHDTDEFHDFSMPTALREMAMDEALARRIFKAVKTERLTLTMHDIGEPHRFKSAEQPIFYYIGRSFVCERQGSDWHVREDHPDTAYRKRWVESDEFRDSFAIMAEHIYVVWPEAWKADFEDVWHGFGLEES